MTRGLSRDQVTSRVYRARRVHFGGSVHGHVEVPPLSQARDGSNFFQFNYSYAGETRAERVVGWGHPALIRLLTYADVFTVRRWNVLLRAVSVLSVRHHDGLRPRIALLRSGDVGVEHMQNRIELLARIALRPSCHRHEHVPGTISCDFEQALINAVGDQFPDSTITGCLFHFKQAIRRRMIKLHISTDEILVAMSRGMLDVLAIIPHEQIDPQGMNYVIARLKADVKERGFEYSTYKWNSFWEYFRRTWLQMFPPKLWNVRGINRQIVNRTNNPLERYNCELNNKFRVQRPSVQTFVGVIERHAHRYLALIEDIARGRARPPPHDTYYTPPEFTL